MLRSLVSGIKDPNELPVWLRTWDPHFTNKNQVWGGCQSGHVGPVEAATHPGKK